MFFRDNLPCLRLKRPGIPAIMEGVPAIREFQTTFREVGSEVRGVDFTSQNVNVGELEVTYK